MRHLAAAKCAKKSGHYPLKYPNLSPVNKSGILHETRKICIFFCVSTFCGLIDAACGFLCILLFQANLYVSISAGYTVGLLSGYFLHKKITFKTDYTASNKSFIKFVIANTSLLGVRFIIAYILRVATSGLPLNEQLKEMAIYLTVLAISFCVNYIMSRLWVFRPNLKKTQQDKSCPQ